MDGDKMYALHIFCVVRNSEYEYVYSIVNVVRTDVYAVYVYVVRKHWAVYVVCIHWCQPSTHMPNVFL